MNITNFLLAILVVGIAWVIFSKPKKEAWDENQLIEENARFKAELSEKDRKIGQLSKEMESERTKKDEFAGKNKQLFAEITSLKAENKSVLKEKETISEELAGFKAEKSRKEKEFDSKIQKMDEIRNALEDEKKRIRREDEEREQREKEERDGMWAQHEDNVKAKLAELCKLPQYNFQTYDNKNLPEGFGGKFKPDFMVEFLGQYVIFDAKVSRSDNLQNYVNGNVKSTVEKISKDSKIYPMVFFVVPNEAMATLTKIRFYEQSYEFFVIPPEAMVVILAAFKKISSYELAEQLDPRDRENIVNLIAEFDYHINMRNALDILSSQSGVSVLEKANTLRKDIKDEIGLKKGKMRLQQFSPTEIRTLLDAKIQQDKIDELTSPKAAIPQENIRRLKSAGVDRLPKPSPLLT
ncbi:MAG: hypothetical protein AAB588_05675 [Patescibacteria group bacterium]